MRFPVIIFLICLCGGCSKQWSPPNEPNNEPAGTNAPMRQSVPVNPIEGGQLLQNSPKIVPPMPSVSAQAFVASPQVIIGPPTPIRVNLAWDDTASASLDFVRTNSLQNSPSLTGPWNDILVWRSDQLVTNYSTLTNATVFYRLKSTPLAAWTPY